MPLLIAGAAGLTVAVLAQRHARFSARQEERRLSGAASDSASATDTGPVEPLGVQARSPYQTADFDIDPESEDAIDVIPPPSVPQRGEAYDTVSADDLGAEWLTRATESMPVTHTASARDELDELEELTTLDMFDDEPSSIPDSNLQALEVVGDANPEDLMDRLERPRPPPGVFDVAELTQEEDAPRDPRRG